MSDMREMTLIEAAQAVVAGWVSNEAWSVGELIPRLRAAIEREEQRAWKPGDKGMLNDMEKLITCITEPRTVVRIESFRGKEWIGVNQIRHLTPKEMRLHWPGGEE